MKKEIEMDYKQSVVIKTSKELAFEALMTGVDQWWGEVDHPAQGEGDVFTVSWGEPWYQFKIIEYNPFSKITWECIEANQIIEGLEGVEKEWVGTKLIWRIESKGDDMVQVSIEHHGLIPEFVCFNVCSSAWDHFITESLKDHLEKSG